MRFLRKTIFILLSVISLYVIVDSLLSAYYLATLTAALFLLFVLSYYKYFMEKPLKRKDYNIIYISAGIFIAVIAIGILSPWRATFSAEHFSYYQIPANKFFYTHLDKWTYMDKQLAEVNKQIISDNIIEIDKEKAIFEYMVLNYQYVADQRSLYKAMTSEPRGANCVGLAMIAQNLFTKAGIKNYLVTGQGDGVDHTWNLVRINGKYYHLDFTTVATPEFREQKGDEIVVKEDAYKYFNMNDEMTEQRHIWKHKDYPASKTVYKDDLI